MVRGSFPAWLGKNSSTSKTKRLVHEIATHTALTVAQGFSNMRLEYIPFLRDRLLEPLMPPRGGADGAGEVVALLDAYGLSKEDFSDSMAELQFTVSQSVSQ